MAKGGQGSAVTSPGGPPLSQEIANLKKTIEDKNKEVSTLKSQLEEKENLIIEKEKIINDTVSFLLTPGYPSTYLLTSKAFFDI